MTDKDETENGVSAVSGGLFKYLAIVCKVMWPAISSKGGPYIHLSFFLSAPPSHLLAPPPPPALVTPSFLFISFFHPPVGLPSY